MKLCMLYRRRVQWATDSNAALPGWAERHAHHCHECQRYTQEQRQMIEMLSGANHNDRETPPFLHGRIMANLHSRSPEPVRSFWASPALKPLLGAVAVLIAFFIVATRQPVPTARPVVAEADVPAQDALESEPSAVLDWSKSLQQPLETELHRVVSDAQAALKGLGANFLPEKALAKAD